MCGARAGYGCWDQGGNQGRKDGGCQAGFAELAQSSSGMKDPPGGSSVPAMPPVEPSYRMRGYASTGCTMPATTPITPSIPPTPTVPAPAMPSAEDDHDWSARLKDCALCANKDRAP